MYWSVDLPVDLQLYNVFLQPPPPPNTDIYLHKIQLGIPRSNLARASILYHLSSLLLYTRGTEMFSRGARLSPPSSDCSLLTFTRLTRLPSASTYCLVRPSPLTSAHASFCSNDDGDRCLLANSYPAFCKNDDDETGTCRGSSALLDTGGCGLSPPAVLPYGKAEHTTL